MLTRRLALTSILLTASLGAFAANDENQANSYDSAWAGGWVAHCRSIYTVPGKTAGYVLAVGDSITNANPYSQWARYGAGKTAEDTAICTWANTTAWGNDKTPFTDVYTVKNGFYAAAIDIANRGATASGGITTDDYLSGNNNGGSVMPTDTVTATAQADLINSAILHNLQVDTVIAAFNDAQFAVIMLGTNDARDIGNVTDFTNNLTTIVNKFEARNIVVILSTIPPQPALDVTNYNTAIRTLAQNHGLPLIDFYAEILARQPGTAWQGTLITAGDVHPTASGGVYNAASDPYTPGGDPTTNTTGDACANVGYLLRNWLTIQKLKQVQSYIVNGVNPLVLTSIGVAPGSVTLNTGGTQQFAATAKDQFGAALSPQPAIAWSVTAGGGSVNASGFYTAGGTAGGYTVTASSGSVSGSASVTVNIVSTGTGTGAGTGTGTGTGTSTSIGTETATGTGTSTSTSTGTGTGTGTGSGASTAPTKPGITSATFKFAVKQSDLNGSHSRFSMQIAIAPLLSQLPKTKRGKPTLAGLGSVTLWLGSASFTASVNAKGRVAGAFSIRLTAGKTPTITIQAHGLNLIALLGIDAASDGAKSIPAGIAAVATLPSGAQVVLYSGFGSSAAIAYSVKKGAATAK